MKKPIFEFENYKTYISQWLDLESRGTLTELAETTGIHKTTLSQIIRGSKDFTLEQAVRVTRFMGLNESETEYFLLLVELERSASAELSQIFRKQLKERKKQHQQLSSRVTRSKILSSEENAVYYSNWIYTAVKSLSAIKQHNTPREIARYLNLEISQVHRVLEFLIASGLCVEKAGRVQPGPQMTHLGAESPLVARHHSNWRIKAMEKHPILSSEHELAYTAPMTLSEKDASQVRALLVELVEKTDQIVGPSPSERFFCMNLDWFEVK